MKHLLGDWLKALGLYLVLVAGGVVLLLTLSSAVGYLPYSDRPGPGWQAPSISISQIGFYLSWATLLVVPCLTYGTVVFLFIRLLRWLGAPSIYVRVLACICAAAISLIVVAGVGWYIAIAAFPVWVAAGLGGVWGAALLPRYAGTVRATQPGGARWALIVLVSVVGPAALYWTLFVPGYSQQLQIQTLRVTPSQDVLSLDGWSSLQPSEVELLKSQFPLGRIHGGLSGTSGGGSVEARMLIVFTEGLASKVKLRIPKGVSVAYVQHGREWKMYPPTARTTSDSITLGPGQLDNEVSFTWPDGSPRDFGWYPPLE